MAIKYSLKYYNIANEQFELTIDIADYSGIPIELRGYGASPVTLNTQLPNIDNPFGGHVANSALAIQVFNEQNIDVTELQQLDALVARVLLYRNGTVIWSGLLSPDGIQSNRSGVAYPLTLNAVDGTASLSDADFNHSNAQPVTVNGQVGEIRSPLNAIRGIINGSSMLNNPLPIRFSTSLRNLQYPNDDALAGRTTWDPYGDYAINFAAKCDAVLHGITQSMKCYFFQHEGYWYLVNREDITVGNGTLSGWEIPAGNGAVTAVPFSIDTNVAPTKFMDDGGYTTVKKSIGEVSVTYDQFVPNNVIPNGGMDSVSLGSVRYWKSNNGETTLSVHEPIDGSISTEEQPKHALEVVNSGQYEDTVTFEDAYSQNLPIDANVLYKNMEWGFHFMAKAGFTTEPDGYINWEKSPLQVSMSYRIDRGQGTEEFFLNQYGFWTDKTGTANLRIEAQGILTGDGFFIAFEASSFPNAKDALVLRYQRNGVWIDKEVVFPELMTLNQAGAYLVSQIEGSQFQPATGTLIIYQITNNQATAETTRSAETIYWIDFLLGDNVRYNDIVSAKFQSKANQGRVLFPDPGSLDNVNSGTLGVLKMSFRTKPGMNYVLDDVYMNIEQNNDVYVITDSSRNSKEEYSLNISSTFSGFSYSSYGSGFSIRQQSSLWRDRNGTARLTELYGRSVMNWRNKPMKIYEGSLQGYIGFDKTVDVDGIKYMPTRVSYDTGMNNTAVTLFQANWNAHTISVKHKGTNDN